jgi:MFS superfamily sulfate permease-like transporter
VRLYSGQTMTSPRRTRRRTHRWPSRHSLVYVCVAIVLLAALLPGVSAEAYIVPAQDSTWLPEVHVPIVRPSVGVAPEQLASFAAAVPPRAPPSLSAVR